MWDLLEVEYKSTQDVQKQNITLMDVNFNEHVIIDKKLFYPVCSHKWPFLSVTSKKNVAFHISIQS